MIAVSCLLCEPSNQVYYNSICMPPFAHFTQKDLKAHPSEIAVFPTPGSPISTGLFFVLLERIWIHLRISSSLPITGSSFPALAIAVRSFPYFSSASYLPSGSVTKANCETSQDLQRNKRHPVKSETQNSTWTCQEKITTKYLLSLFTQHTPASHKLNV